MKPGFFSLATALVVITVAPSWTAKLGVAEERDPAFPRAVACQEAGGNHLSALFQEFERSADRFTEWSEPSQFLAFDADRDDPVSPEEPDEVEACVESPSVVPVGLRDGEGLWTARQC